MRARLYAAVRCLLADKSLEGAPDSVRLAAVVLLAKAPARSAVLRLRAGEMGRWLGFSESYVDHKVLPAMREAGVVETDALTDESGRVTGLEWKFLPLLAARESGDPMHPLALVRKDLATLLRFCEALFAPGWAPIDGPVTPPGLLAARRGRGAATDRLALLLLALQTRPDGRVRLVGGSVKESRGRADATVAKALGCSVSGGGKVVDRLERLQLVEVVRGTTETGQYGKGRLVVPAVASAFGRGGAPLVVVEDVVEEPQEAAACPSCAHGSVHGEDGAAGEVLVLSGEGWQQESFDDVEPEDFQRPAAAPGDLEGASEPEEPLTSGEEAPGAEPEPGLVERPAGAPLHADHAPGVSLSGSLSLSGGFSGGADPGCGDLPERAGTREDGPDHTCAAAAGRGLGGPLRGEQQQEADGESGRSVELGSVKGSAKPSGTLVFVRPAALPAGLESVLAPVRVVWERILRPAARRHVTAAVRVQLGALRGIVGPQDAEQALAERLERRLDQQMGRPVTDPVGWILGRGLVQRAWCWSQLCDEGRRMDTGADCPSCQVLIGDRRGLRARIAAETARELAGAAPQVLQAEMEKRLNAAVTYEAAAQAVRRERAVAEQQARAQVVEQRRAEYAAAERERLARPCDDCGIPDAAGRCLLCTERRAVDRALAEAVDFAVMARADLADQGAVAEATKRCTADTRALLEQHLDRLRADGADEGGLLLAARETADKIRDRRRESLNVRLMRSTEAEAEADKAYDAKMRAAHRFPNREMAEAAAERVADEALLRAVEFLFADRARQLRIARGEQPARPVATDWSSRCAELADQELPEDPAERSGSRVLEAVSAA
ncbi:hypothetical protein OG883_43880 [Streptomyces sp. NBC_01142]|uniref:hypothetical protein n=1 Tax=Streptomyces sp. NBC_01142 TaxID=2975865 RepID=UPI00225A8B74|nr:hypothetical protein [Streptomyces sp. NBC_01142]MCX4826582.1 hypothetical protein [Streptomyces sp. NBC_01142]